LARSKIRNLRRQVHWKLLWQKFIQSFLQKIKFSENIFMLLGGLVIGVGGGYFYIGFRWLIQYVQGIAWGGWVDPILLLDTFKWYWIIIIPSIGGLLTGLIIYFVSTEAKGHGVPEVMEANALKGGVIRARVPIAKAVASAISIGTGGSVGREGPMVQIGAAMGSIIGQVTQVTTRKMKTFVGCGAAAGIAATFNAPIAGALFALEIILGDFGVAHFSPIVISSVAATTVTHHYIQEFQTFAVPHYQLVSPWEFIPYAILGILTGLIAILFIRVLYKTEDIFDDLKIPLYAKTVIGGVGLGLLAFVYPQILGTGYEAVNAVMHDNLVWSLAGVLLVWKLLATSITLGSGASGGIFAPSLFLGAMAGGFLGHFAHMWFPNITASAGAYALVGMAGVVGAATHAPLTAILIIFELTNEYQIILPVMLTTIVATVFAMVIQKESIYTLKLLRRGIDIFRGRDVNVLRTLEVSSAMRRSIERVRSSATLRELTNLMVSSNHTVFFIVDDSDQVTGYLTFNDLRKLIQDTNLIGDLVIAADIAHPMNYTLSPKTTLDRSMELFAQEGIDELPISDGESRYKPVATLWRQDVIEAYNREIFRRDMATSMATKLQTTGMSAQPIEIVNGFSILEREVPKFMVGRSIRGTHIRDRYGVQIILVEQPKEGEDKVREVMPHADYRFGKQDVILLFGETKNVERFQHI